MKFIKINNRLTRTNWHLLGLGILFLIVWQMPALNVLKDIVLMSLPLHMFAETFSIIVSMLVFAVVFNTSAVDRYDNPIIILAFSFFVVGLLDFAHTLSYPGMPDFVTPGLNDKSIFFWLVARYVAAIALLVTALQLRIKNTRMPNRYWMLFASLVFTAFFYWIGLYHLNIMPHTFIEGRGLTPFKVWAEYGIIAILLVPAVLFYLHAKKQHPFDVKGIYAAIIITILSELCFTLYSNITGLFIFMGHVYKVIAYIYIFKSIFVFVVRAPYQKLYESEQYNRTLFESSSIGLSVCTMDGTFIDINQSFANIIGRSIDDIKRLTYREITPEDFTIQEELLLKSLVEKKHYGPYEKEYFHSNGNRIPVRLSVRLINRNGQPLIWSNVQDISAEREAVRAQYESEQHFRQLAENIREVFWLTDIKINNIFYISPAYETVWGKTCESLYADPASFFDAVHHDDRDFVRQSIAHQSDGPVIIEFRIVQPDGSIRWIKDQSFPIKDKNGVIYRIAGIFEDITEEKLSHELLEKRVIKRTESLHQKEIELISARDEAERANLAKSQFLSSMSHELRTPLNAIMGFSQLLELDDSLNSNQQESIREILNGGKHLLDLINGVLDLAKIESGNFEIFLNEVDICAVLKECLMLSAPLMTKKEIKLSVHNDSLSRADVYSDRTRLKQIILNLISNACKYNHMNGSIEIICLRTGEDTIRLCVKDTGRGIEKEQQGKVFEPFIRLGADDDSTEGTGIGLSITRQLIEMMGGKIGFESEPGQGSMFYIELPEYSPVLKTKA